MNGFVLAGGRSTRMGRDKATLRLGDQLLVVRALDLLRRLGLNPRICGSRPDLAGFGEVIFDRTAEAGPLGGIEAALSASDAELNLFLPVDLPLMPGEFVHWMMERAELSHAVATIPRLGDRPQPLCAVYSRRLAAGLRGSMESGRLKVMTAIGEAAAALGEGVDLFQTEAVAALSSAWPATPPLRDWFRNVNTPEDYAALNDAQSNASGALGAHPIS